MTDPRPSNSVTLHLFGRTDVGQIREHNEDNFLVANLTRKSRSLAEADRRQELGQDGIVLGVCDGMGGAAAGEVASQLAVDTIYERLSTAQAPRDHDELAQRLVHAVEEAGARIFAEARADRSRRGMGTTSTIAALMDRRLFVAQVGDSRAYMLRGDTFKQISRDQSLVTQLIEAGQLTEEEAETFEHNNIILQALGTSETVQVDLTFIDLCEGDTLLICSDGLSGMVKNTEMREVLLGTADPVEACRVLIEKANQAGGHDNITVIVARFSGTLPPASEAEPPIGYLKYTFADTPAPPRGESIRPSQATIREVPRASIPSEPPGGRKFRVGATMVGMVGDLGADDTRSEVPRPRSSAPPPVFDTLTDPVDIPTTGMPPKTVGVLLLVSLVVVGVLGFWLLR